MKFPQYTVINQQLTAECHAIQFALDLSPELDFFDGHFEQLAILPAVAQLFMVKKLADQHVQVSGAFTGLRQLKFKSPITPNSATHLSIEYKIQSCQLLFKYERLGQLKSKGILQFESHSSAQS